MDFFREIFKFFIAKEYSFTSKFVGVLVVVLTLFFIDNLLGFSFYYSNNQKITQLRNIETLKKECISNPDLLKTLNATEQKIINRKNVIEIFFNLFSQEALDNKKKLFSNTDTVYIIKYDTIKLAESNNQFLWNNFISDSLINDRKDSSKFKNKELDTDSIEITKTCTIQTQEKTTKFRSRIWHTLSSSYLLIFIMIILPIIPFSKKPFDWGMMIGMLIGTIILAGLIWLNQYLFSLIPVILNKPWINYGVNFLIHSCFWIVPSLKSYFKKNKT